jgi:hypothetical protein
VVACSPDLRRFQFAVSGLANCVLDTAVPGDYTLTFAVRNSFASTEVRRVVTVLATCGTGERRCEDAVHCTQVPGTYATRLMRLPAFGGVISG